MTRRILGSSLVLALPAVLGLSGCDNLALFRNDVSLDQVDSLTKRIQIVAKELEGSKKQIDVAIDSLHIMIRNEEGKDTKSAYSNYLSAVAQSDKQARRLYDNVAPMERTAEAFFEQWAVDLESFTNPDIRQRSQVRMATTRERYEEILVPLDPALSGYDAFNLYLHDIALFLGRDFNSTSVVDIEPDVRQITERVTELQARLDLCIEACQAYVNAVTLPGYVTVHEAEGTPERGVGRGQAAGGSGEGEN